MCTNRWHHGSKWVPSCSVASATLASVSALPPATMLGHVMPSFPHTLIGLGPFANQGCNIVFDKTSVTVFHLDGHPILNGWWDLHGTWLWQFPLTASPPAPALLPPVAPVSVGPSAAMLAFQPHPSQCIQATSAAGEDTSIVILYEATNVMAMTTQASSTPYNPRTLDLPVCKFPGMATFLRKSLNFFSKKIARYST
jgi:hypothetical protein